MVRLIAIIALVYVAYRLRGIWKDMLNPRPGSYGDTTGNRITDVMIPCEQCEAYFPGRDGVEFHRRGKPMAFCSEECLETYRRRREHPKNDD